MRYVVLCVAAVLVGWCACAVRSDDPTVVPGSHPDHPLEVLFVRQLIVVDKIGAPRIKLRTTDMASVIAVIGPHSIEEQVSISSLADMGSHISVRDEEGKTRGGIDYLPHQQYATFWGNLDQRP